MPTDVYVKQLEDRKRHLFQLRQEDKSVDGRNHLDKAVREINKKLEDYRRGN